MLVVNYNPQFGMVLTESLSFSLQAASPRWEPQISVLCEAGQTYHPQYLSEEGRWSTDLSIKVPGSTCLRDKMDLLDYCKKVSQSKVLQTAIQNRACWGTSISYGSSNVSSSLLSTRLSSLFGRLNSQSSETSSFKMSNLKRTSFV